MIELILTTKIDAPINVVFDSVRDVETHPRTTIWTGEQIISTTSRHLELGDVVTFRARHFGIWQSLTAEVVEYEVPTKLVDVMIKGAFKSLRHEHLFQTEENGTLMTDCLRIEAPFGPLGWLAERLFLARYMKSFLKRRNQELKRLLEEPDK